MEKVGLINSILERYGVDAGEKTLDIIENIAKKRALIINKTEIDYLRVSKLIVKDYRDGNFGRITLEKPE